MRNPGDGSNPNPSIERTCSSGFARFRTPLMSSACALKLTRLETRKGLKKRGNEWLEMYHPIGRSQDEKYPEG